MDRARAKLEARPGCSSSQHHWMELDFGLIDILVSTWYGRFGVVDTRSSGFWRRSYHGSSMQKLWLLEAVGGGPIVAMMVVYGMCGHLEPLDVINSFYMPMGMGKPFNEENLLASAETLLKRLDQKLGETHCKQAFVNHIAGRLCPSILNGSYDADKEDNEHFP
ncbi:hypothetical protein M9H77_08692 [Catharanthus roseus]|uniref:Uncharacterized protein n=1 Tax=Catharanthus roseus TaxID=4058 RepID=A0ACC0BYR7_CATRO|nr:hypothetical protein M9H77_08692 [Catharanthus roseus]